MDCLTIICILLMFVCIPAQPPDVEFRSMWIASVNNIDWPSASGLPTSTQQQELLDYLALLSAMNINSLIFQVRPVGDAFYNSSLEPWSVYLTGTQGVAPDPYYDPLQFVLTEAHSRGIQVHAWINPYRAEYHSTSFDGLHPSHMARRFPQYAYQYSDYIWMDPGAEEIVDHLIDVLTDILTRYDIDGIHYDDYFYPYPEGGQHFPDNATYDNYIASGGNMSLADWRRDNVNRMVSRVYDTVKAFDKQVSISPFGLYRPGHPEGMPPPIVGSDPYEDQYADTKLWLQQGWLDLFIPQIYWEIDPPEQSYPLILDWWLEQNILNKTIYAGLACHKLDPNRGDWPTIELVNQVGISREPANRIRGSLGNSHFGALYFRDNLKNVVQVYQDEIYSTNASIPQTA